MPIEAFIKAQAYGLGFDLVGLTNTGPVESAPRFDAWLERGYDGTMTYLARGAERRRDTRRPVPDARSAIVVGLDYGGAEPSGPVARYARGLDYHDVMLDRLNALHRAIAAHVDSEVAGKAYVDTGPVLERDLARRAGLGWFGKNTNLLHTGRGSYFFLGALLVDLALEPDAPFTADHCGTCRRCIDACPTGALVDERVLDATRCISYLTIELREEIPLALREAVGDLLYGCDVCQEVCPWNERFARSLPADSPFAPRPAVAGRDARALAREVLSLTPAKFTEAYRGSPMKRAKLRGLKRNAAVVLGNAGDTSDADVLLAALDDPEPLVREHAAWALARIRERTSTETSG